MFRQLFDRETCTYTYLIADMSVREAVLVDPVLEQFERDRALLLELGLKLKYVVETHCHADHITSASKFRKCMGALVCVHELGAKNANVALGHGSAVDIGDTRIEVFETPGHTDDSISLYIPAYPRSQSAVLTGDTLLIRGCGRTDFQKGNAEQLYDSIVNVLFGLPDEVRVWPGHDYRGLTSSSIAEEKALNPRLANRSKKEFVAIMNGLNLPPPKNLSVAVPANKRCGEEQ